MLPEMLQTLPVVWTYLRISLCSFVNVISVIRITWTRESIYRQFPFRIIWRENIPLLIFYYPNNISPKSLKTLSFLWIYFRQPTSFVYFNFVIRIIWTRGGFYRKFLLPITRKENIYLLIFGYPNTQFAWIA